MPLIGFVWASFGFFCLMQLSAVCAVHVEAQRSSRLSGSTEECAEYNELEHARVESFGNDLRSSKIGVDFLLVERKARMHAISSGSQGYGKKINCSYDSPNGSKISLRTNPKTISMSFDRTAGTRTWRYRIIFSVDEDFEYIYARLMNNAGSIRSKNSFLVNERPAFFDGFSNTAVRMTIMCKVCSRGNVTRRAIGVLTKQPGFSHFFNPVNVIIETRNGRKYIVVLHFKEDFVIQY